MGILLKTKRLILRSFDKTDLRDLIELNSDPDVLRFINGGKPIHGNRIKEIHLPGFLHLYPGIKTYGYWAAELIETRCFVGYFELRPLVETSPEVVELGYRLRKSMWRKGYCTEGSRALIHKGFTELGVQRVTTNTMTVNTTSRRVIKKLGFTYLRTSFEDSDDEISGSEQGDREYLLNREDWEKFIDSRNSHEN